MGDRYHLKLKCASCGEIEEDAYYSESLGFMHFVCSNCKKINWISIRFVTEIVSKKHEKELYKKNGFE